MNPHSTSTPAGVTRLCSNLTSPLPSKPSRKPQLPATSFAVGDACHGARPGTDRTGSLRPQMSASHTGAHLQRESLRQGTRARCSHFSSRMHLRYVSNTTLTSVWSTPVNSRVCWLYEANTGNSWLQKRESPAVLPSPAKKKKSLASFTSSGRRNF